MSQPQTAVSIRAVRKVYGDPLNGPVALKQVDLDIYDNEFFTLLGPSGCGKTTLLRMIAGFEFPTRGQILLYGEDIAERPPYERSVNTVFQHYALFPHMTIAENLAFGLESQAQQRGRGGRTWSKAQITERIREMLALVQMERFAQRKPAQLSGGQQQRIALARALTPQPRVLLLDEPLSALDLKLRQAMREELKSIQARTGITFVFVTHDQEEALAMSDRIAVLSEGEVQQVGRPYEIYERPRNRFIADFVGETNFIGCQVTHIGDGLARLHGPGGLWVDTPADENLGVGRQATLSMRPERLRLVADGGEALACTVDGVSYLGTDLHYRVRLADGTALSVRTPNNAEPAQRYAVGSRAGLLIDKTAASVLLD